MKKTGILFVLCGLVALITALLARRSPGTKTVLLSRLSANATAQLANTLTRTLLWKTALTLGGIFALKGITGKLTEYT